MIIATARDVDELVGHLLNLLGVQIPAGQITLNINESRVQSIETKTFTRLDKALEIPVSAPIAATIQAVLDKRRATRA